MVLRALGICVGFVLVLAHAIAAEPQVSAAPADQQAWQEATSSVDAFNAALKTGDRDAAIALLDDQVLIFESGWVERSKADYVSEHLAGDISFLQAITVTQTKRSGGFVGDLAYVTSESTMTGQYKDKTVNSVSIETMVLRRSQSKWRIVHIHWSSRKLDG